MAGPTPRSRSTGVRRGSGMRPAFCAAAAMAGIGAGLLDDARDERLDLPQRGDAGYSGAAQETKRRQERRERERQRFGRSPAAGHGASASSGSSAYSTKSTSRISYSRSPPGVRIFTE